MAYNIIEQPIHVYTCMTDPARPCIAIIDRWPMTFSAPTPMQARKKADQWRREAVRNDKMIPKLRKAEMLGDVA